MEISKEQFEYWKSLPETQTIFKTMHQELNEMIEYLAEGGTIDVESSDRTALLTTGLVHRIRGLKSLLGMKHEEEV